MKANGFEAAILYQVRGWAVKVMWRHILDMRRGHDILVDSHRRPAIWFGLTGFLCREDHFMMAGVGYGSETASTMNERYEVEEGNSTRDRGELCAAATTLGCTRACLL